VSQVHACNTVNVLIPLDPYIGQLSDAIPSSGLQDDTSVVDTKEQDHDNGCGPARRYSVAN
jgi:hypothetical protein